MAPRIVSTHGPFGLLNRSPNGRAYGVTPFFRPSAMNFVRGSEPVYLLLVTNNKYTGSDPRTKFIADGLKNGVTPYALPFGDLFNNPNGPWVETIRAAIYGPDLEKALKDGQAKIQAGLDSAG